MNAVAHQARGADLLIDVLDALPSPFTSVRNTPVSCRLHVR